MLEKTLESHLDCKEIQPVHPKGNQFWILIGRNDAETEAPILWSPDSKSWLIWKDPDAGKDWRQKEKGMSEDEIVDWLHQLDGHEFEKVLGVGDGQGSLVCCGPRDHKELDTTERLNWADCGASTGAHLQCELFFFFLVWVRKRGSTSWSGLISEAIKERTLKFENGHFVEKLSNFSKSCFLLSEVSWEFDEI